MMFTFTAIHTSHDDCLIGSTNSQARRDLKSWWARISPVRASTICADCLDRRCERLSWRPSTTDACRTVVVDDVQGNHQSLYIA